MSYVLIVYDYQMVSKGKIYTRYIWYYAISDFTSDRNFANFNKVYKTDHLNTT